MTTLDTHEPEQWLLLTDYASKYRISVSTLRRRIKANQIRHRFENGKYLLLDEYPAAITIEKPVSFELDAAFHEGPSKTSQPVGKLPDLGTHLEALREEPILSTATRLLNELKAAYTGILHEKEEQMIQLKVEVSDLKTLVMVLESENERLRRIMYPHE